MAPVKSPPGQVHPCMFCHFSFFLFIFFKLYISVNLFSNVCWYIISVTVSTLFMCLTSNKDKVKNKSNKNYDIS